MLLEQLSRLFGTRIYIASPVRHLGCYICLSRTSVLLLMHFVKILSLFKISDHVYCYDLYCRRTRVFKDDESLALWEQIEVRRLLPQMKIMSYPCFDLWQEDNRSCPLSPTSRNEQLFTIYSIAKKSNRDRRWRHDTLWDDMKILRIKKGAPGLVCVLNEDNSR